MLNYPHVPSFGIALDPKMVQPLTQFLYAFYNELLLPMALLAFVAALRLSYGVRFVSGADIIAIFTAADFILSENRESLKSALSLDMPGVALIKSNIFS